MRHPLIKYLNATNVTLNSTGSKRCGAISKVSVCLLPLKHHISGILNLSQITVEFVAVTRLKKLRL